MGDVTDDRSYVSAVVNSERTLTNEDVRDAELERARHALAYLKKKLGNDAMRELLADDVDLMKRRVRDWVAASNGQWRTGSVELFLDGRRSQPFHDWYVRAMAQARETELRAGHPEHFVSHPTAGTIEVFENIGETELPWRVFYRPVADDADYPAAWDQDYPVRFGAEIVDADGARVGFTMHESRDVGRGMRLRLSSFLPAASPPELLRRHLDHFAIEFRNWTRFAWLESLKH